MWITFFDKKRQLKAKNRRTANKKHRKNKPKKELPTKQNVS